MILNAFLVIVAAGLSFLLFGENICYLYRIGNVRKAFINFGVSTFSCFFGFYALLSVLDRFAR